MDLLVEHYAELERALNVTCGVAETSAHPRTIRQVRKADTIVPTPKKWCS